MLRILFLTNFYPPFEIGGQGRSCSQMVQGLQKRGHEVLVLTSMHGTGNRPISAAGVCRELYLEMDLSPLMHALIFFTRRKARLKANLRRLARAIDEFAPDIIFVWGMWNLSPELPAYVEARHPEKAVYRFAEYWPTLPSQHELYWHETGKSLLTRILRMALRPLALSMLSKEDSRTRLRFDRAICVSDAIRQELVDAGVPVGDASVIHTGLDVDEDPQPDWPRRPERGGTLQLLYAGRFTQTKGIETALAAMRDLAASEAPMPVSLALAGSGSPEYTAHLRRLVSAWKLQEHVTFLGWITHADMPALMRKFHALVVPSEWPDPFPRVVLEAMLAELVVVAADAGGIGEIVEDERNGLLFVSGDSKSLADALRKLAARPALAAQWAQAGCETILHHFNLNRMVDAYEAYLLAVAGVETHCLGEM
jgi:glycosyltransferase involved in cell wall biosynthesis